MSGDKPKYVRKKCEHNKYSFQCRECNGVSFCEHDRVKYNCKECKGSNICEHNSLKNKCVQCKGSSICEHNKRRSRCIKCKGGSICEHNTVKSRCVECKGSEICEHTIRKERCKECNGSSICEHNKRKNRCVECKGSLICEHNKEKSYCVDCHGSNICEHNKIRYQCLECGGKRFCEHKKRKSHCKTCGGSSLCKSEWCEITANTGKYDGYCLNCFIHLFPDKPNARNYKTKEKATTDYILEHFPNFTWVVDKKIQDGCSRKRPDLFLDLGYQIIIVEVDENQHQNYDCSCENKRLMELSQDVGHRPIIFIRFNPDDYINNTTKITSCWGINKSGICGVKKSKIIEWDTRLETLKNQIKYWCKPKNITEKTLEVIQLFYDTIQ